MNKTSVERQTFFSEKQPLIGSPRRGAKLDINARIAYNPGMQENTETHSTWKSILIGGTAAGVLSLIPFINLLNLFFMLWMGVGGAITVYLLQREYKQVKNPEALLTGALSGVWGCTVFGVFIYFAISRIPPERFVKAASMLRAFIPEVEEELTMMLQGDNLQVFTLIIIAVLMVFSIISGAVGGILSKHFSTQEQEENE